MQATNQTTHLDLGRHVPHHGISIPPAQRAWVIWSLSALFVLFQFFIQLSSGEILGGVMHSFALSAFSSGLVISSYYYVYVLLQAPAGLLIDRFGPKRLLSIGALVLSLGSYGFACSTVLIIAVFARLMMGAGAAFAFVGCLNLTAQWFPRHRFALMTAYAEMFGMLGAILGSLFLASMVSHFGWRQCMFYVSMVAVVFAVALWRIIRDRQQTPAIAVKPSMRDFLPELLCLFRRPVVWLNAAYSGLLFAVVTVFIALWAVPFLEYTHHMSLVMATAVANCAFLGVALACPCLGYIDARTHWRRVIVVVFPVIGAGCLLGVLFIQAISFSALICLMLLLGVSLSPYILTFVIGNQISTANTQATSVGIVNMVSVGTAPILQPLVGGLLDHHPGHWVVSGLSYSLSQYQSALVLVPICLLVAAVIGYFLPNRT